MTAHIDIVFDSPPSPVGPRFVEVENMAGHSIRLGKWINRPDGYWCLRVTRKEFEAATEGRIDE